MAMRSYNGQINISNISSENKIYTGNFPEIQDGYNSLPIAGILGSCYPTVFFRPKAVRQLFEFIRWGETTQENQLEQVLLPYGYICQEESPDPSNPIARRWSVVTGVVPVYTPESSGTNVRIQAEEWQKAVLQIERENEGRKEKNGQYQPLGWIHTHPNWLDPFFSQTDVEYQSLYAGSNDRFGAVFNPQRQIWAVYSGPESRPAAGILELDDDLRREYSFVARSTEEIRKKDPILLQPSKAKNSYDYQKIASKSLAFRQEQISSAPGKNAFSVPGSDEGNEHGYGVALTYKRTAEEGRWDLLPEEQSISLDSIQIYREYARVLPSDEEWFIVRTRQSEQDGIKLEPLAVLLSQQYLDFQVSIEIKDSCAILVFIHAEALEGRTREFYHKASELKWLPVYFVTDTNRVYYCPFFNSPVESGI